MLLFCGGRCLGGISFGVVGEVVVICVGGVCVVVVVFVLLCCDGVVVLLFSFRFVLFCFCCVCVCLGGVGCVPFVLLRLCIIVDLFFRLVVFDFVMCLCCCGFLFLLRQIISLNFVVIFCIT